MRYNSIERIGVNEIERIFIRDFEWIFRDQPIVDVGIDALVEQSDDGNPKGKFIALQIKSGKGNFHFSNNKLTYYISNIHYNYWLNFDIPVMLIAYIPETQETYWEEISEYRIKRARRRWKLDIPLSNKLNIKAKPAFTKIISNCKSESLSVKIFQGEKIEEQNIYDLAEKVDCISDANKSISNIIQFLNENTDKNNENNEKLKRYSDSKSSKDSPQVIAWIKSNAKNWTILSLRLENECKIFAETFGMGIYSIEQLLILYFQSSKDKSNIKSLIKSLAGLPMNIESAISALVELKTTFKGYPNFTQIKVAKTVFLDVLDLLINENNIAKGMILNLLDKIEKEK